MDEVLRSNKPNPYKKANLFSRLSFRYEYKHILSYVIISSYLDQYT